VRPERGTASLFVVGLTGVLLLIGMAAAFVVATAAAHRRAQGAADLAALAAATALQQGADPCGVAVSFAGANGASLTSCRVLGEDVSVQVAVEGPQFLGHGWEPVGRARAGP
jgi:secretion/DNA translocation related TadE-like protein